MKNYFLLDEADKTSVKKLYEFEIIESRRKLTKTETATKRGLLYCFKDFDLNLIPVSVRNEIKKNVNSSFLIPDRFE